jgi:hypothetical protein
LRLVFIDPLSDYCGGAGLLGETILTLNAIAAERDVAILVTRTEVCPPRVGVPDSGKLLIENSGRWF